MLRLLTALLLLAFSLPALGYIDEVSPPYVTFSEYKTNYFLFGKPNTKIQLSMKAQVIPYVPFFIGYTQLMIWELGTQSAPFRDINYNPEFFYRFGLGEASRFRWIDFGIFEHESNGRAGDDSRSWNRTYVRYSDSFPASPDGKSRLHWSFKLSVPYLYRHDNPDYPEYRGIWEATLSLTGLFGDVIERDALTLRIYPGGAIYINPLLGGQELTLRFKFSFSRFAPIIVGQLFHGYAENMLDYKDEHFGIRAGFGF